LQVVGHVAILTESKARAATKHPGWGFMADYRDTIDAIFGEAREDKKRFLAATPGNLPCITAAKPFANPGQPHARQVISKLVRETEVSLAILSRKLSTTGHSSLRLRAQLARRPSAQIRVLVEGSKQGPIYPSGRIDWRNLHGSALAELVVDAHSSGEEIFSIDGSARDGRIAVRAMPVESRIHFMVSDGFAFRLERDHERGKAIVNPKDPATASTLLTKFDAIWNLSTPVTLPVLHRAAA
jgi:hypothetical protein